MGEFKEYQRKATAQVKEVTNVEIAEFKEKGFILVTKIGPEQIVVSISDEDRRNGSPLIGDMIARNPKNHNDQWLIAEKYFNDNFTKI